MPRNTEQITVHIPPELREAAQAAADTLERPLGWWVRKAMEQQLHGLKLGQYTIEDHGYPGKLFIRQAGGEGMEVSTEALDALIGEYYADNF